MTADYVAPAFDLDGFHCPHCGVFAHQTWADAMTFDGANIHHPDPPVRNSVCARCKRTALWADGELVFPSPLVAPPPHDDLADPALSTYKEARSVASPSPRAAAALLRVCLQQLVPLVGAKSDDLNTAIGELVIMGLPPRVQQALDTVRFIGNEAVHPGTIDLNDDPQVALSLFGLVNIVVETMVTQPKMIADLYGRLPPTKIEAIERRDKPKGRGTQ